MKKFRNYFVLFNTTYLVLTNLLIPVGFAVATLLLSFVFGSAASIIILYFIYTVVDGMTDYFGFGNLYQKNNMGMDFLKTSFEGMVVMKDALHIDYFSRFVRPAVFMGLAYALNYRNFLDDKYLTQVLVLLFGTTNLWLMILEMYLFFVFLQVLLANIDRYLSMAQTVYTLNSFVIIGADALIVLLLYWGAHFGTPVLLAIVVTTIVLLMAEAIVVNIHMNRKLEMSFYDEVEKEE